MTPDRRLDQVEPALADGLQKIDRLIDGQGKLVELATSINQKANTTAKGVANLTLKVDTTAEGVANLTLKVDTTAEGVANLTLKVDQIAEDQAELRQGMQKNVAKVDGKVTQVDEKVDNLRTEMNQRFDQLIMLIQERLS